jgi:dienelactone hydrolase
LFQNRFNAAIALYAGMVAQAQFIAPVLLMLAAEDDWTPLARTEGFVKASEATSQPITLKVYPDALGGFDDPDRGTKFYLADAYNPRSATGKGATLGYNAAAAADALQQVQDFLGKYLK